MFKKSTVLAVSVGVALAGIIIPTTQVQAATSKNLDDHSSDARYRKYYRQKIGWNKHLPGCPNLMEPYGPIECALIKVPKDWNDSSKGDLQIAISHRLGTKIKGHRLLLSAPDQLGGSGITKVFSAKGAYNNHMSVGIEPRGVGLSTRLSCPAINGATDTLEANPDPRTFTEQQVRNSDKNIADQFRACASQPDSLLPYLNSWQIAFDYNLVRALMGVTTADYAAGGYGSWLGAVIKRAFPDTFAHMILEKNLDWSQPSLEAAYDWRLQGIPGTLDRALLPYFARHSGHYRLGKTTAEVAENYERVRAELANHPEVSTPRKLDAAFSAVLDVLSNASDASAYLHAVATLIGTPISPGMFTEDQAQKIVTTMKFPVQDELYISAVMCGDGPAVVGHWEKYRDHARAMPLVQHGVVDRCAQWPYQPVLSQQFFDRPVRALLFQNENDPSAPYPGGLNALRKSKGELRMVLNSNQSGHVIPRTPEKETIVEKYLKTDELPATDLRFFARPMDCDNISDGKIYEVFNPSTAEHPLPEPYFYLKRDLSDPPIDEEGTTAIPALH